VTACSDIADYEWLTGDEGCGLLNELGEFAAPLHAIVKRLRGQLSPERTHLVLDQIDLRRRAAVKFSQAHRMFFTRVGLEQATDEWTACYKASRFAGARPGFSPSTADLCCGIGGDLLAMATAGTAVGIDCNPIATHFAAANTGTVVHTADAADFDLREFDAWHIDPDRRAGGRRTTSLEFCQPDVAAIERLVARLPHAAMKLAPATKVPHDWTVRCELEWISLDHQCRQLVAWHGRLALAPGKHRATILRKNSPSRSGDELVEGRSVRTITGLPNHPIPIANQLDRYIFDIDAAVLAAGLKGVLAAEHNLSALSAGPTYLTGPHPIEDSALACFEVLDVLPIQLRKLAPYLRERTIGQLEIKKRGIDIDPERLRRDLKLRGDNEATLLLTRIAARPTAVLARRLR
jgi:hypothetical protein